MIDGFMGRITATSMRTEFQHQHVAQSASQLTAATGAPAITDSYLKKKSSD